MNKLILTVLLVFLIVSPVMAADGMINIQSNFSVKETAYRLESILKEKKMTIFQQISHSESARKVGIELRATHLIIFGNPKAGSPLMQCQQSVAIDLPQKALIWKDDQSKVWISYNDPMYLIKRHSISGCEEKFSKIKKALSGILGAAAKK